MADLNAVDVGAPNLNLTAEEKRVFGQLFRQADTENIGVVTGEVAVKFFEKTRLEPRVLGEIWQIADKENRGLLTPAGFGVVLRLIGHYQAGQDPTPELALQPGPLPKFDGVVTGASSIQPPPGPPPGALQPQASGAGPIRVPPLTPDKVNQYAALFDKSGAQNGVLPGEQAKQIFERAGLPNEILGRIWNLADTEQRGALVATEFIIAMHLLASFKSGAMRALPAILPAGLYEAAARRPPSRSLSSAAPAISAIPRQFSGAGPGRAGSPLGRLSYSAPSVNPQSTGQSFQAPYSSQAAGQSSDWAVTPADKMQFDNIFAGIDKNNRGFITGDEAVPFFSNSKLPEEVLAQIWDLADINSQGHLTREEFAVAMFLIRQQRAKRDGRDSLPPVLPPNLIPPSMRNQIKPASQPAAPIFESSQSLPKSAVDDLFGLDALSAPQPPAAFMAPLSTGGSNGFGDPFSNSRSIGAGSPGPDSPVQTGFKPFAPTSSFGKSLSTSGTGVNPPAPHVQGRSITKQPSALDDLLGDPDPEISKKLTNETTELANLSNQVGSLSKQMQEVQVQRTTAQNELDQASSQKREFELRLTQLRSLYEQEVKDVKSLQERLAASRAETKKIQQDQAIIDGSYQDLQNQHRQIVAALQADQQENASLKERMRVVNAEIAQMKPQLEKLRSDARQQKGLVAINKKQLLTNEGERDKLKTEADELTKSNEEHSKAILAASPIQSPGVVASPAPSAMSTTNPFFRRQGSTSDSATFSPFSAPSQSPAPAHEAERSFDNVFGPSFAAVAPVQPGMPPTTFKGWNETHEDTPSTARHSHSLDGESPSPALAAQPSLSTQEITPVGEPPAPPESRQMSSSFLPFPEEVSNSLSSSRQVSPPNSRFDDVSTGADTPSGTTPAGSSAAGLPDIAPVASRNISASPITSEKLPIPNGKDEIPGAFSDDTSSQVSATPTGGSALSEKVVESSLDDPFGLKKDQPRSSAAAKDDFDSAFAGFGGPLKPQERQNSAGHAKAMDVNQEFPAIEMAEPDDDSDSASEHGFDDDFTTASPGRPKELAATLGPSASSGFAESNMLDVARPKMSHAASAASSIGAGPPTPNAQSSPPAYDQVASPHDKAVAEAEMYSGLLPTREDPTSPPQSPLGAIASAPLTAGNSLFANNLAKPTTATFPATNPATIAASPPTAKSTTVATPAPPAKVPFDDFDDFDNLEDANEGDADDDFANISTHDRSGLDDFNPTFDSLPVSKSSTHTGQPTSAFGESSNGLGDLTPSPAAVKSTAAVPGTINDNDWDAMFAGLEPAKTSPTGFEDIVSSPSKPLGNGTAATLAAPVTKDRPSIGRALTEAGEHDDPILKNLTSMGYPRSDALSALEKYDYNLERAANYLASQS